MDLRLKNTTNSELQGFEYIFLPEGIQPDKLLYLIIFSRGNPKKHVLIHKYTAVSSKEISVVAVVEIIQILLLFSLTLEQDTNSES